MSNQQVSNPQQRQDSSQVEESNISEVSYLTQAFERFTKETQKLEKAYSSLKKQFRTVNLQLEETNHDLQENIAELDATTNYLNGILSNIAQGIIFVNLSGIVTTYNRAAENIFEVPSVEITSRKFWDHFQDDIFGFSMRETLLRRKDIAVSYATYISPRANNKELEISANFLLKGNKQTQGSIIVLRDITEIRRLQTLANRHDRLQELGELAASVAHEIRNPLGGIEGFASLLHRDLESSPQLQLMAQNIIEGTRTLNRLVGNVLHYARPMHTHFELVDLSNIVTETCELMNADQNFSNSIRCNVIVPEVPIIAAIDRSMLKSALLNITVNASQAMPDGGDVTISLARNSSHAVININDMGVGIPPENFEKVFSPFFTTKTTGNGFGLSEVHKIIQTHGGLIDISSVPGNTTFSIKIPLTQNPAKGGDHAY